MNVFFKRFIVLALLFMPMTTPAITLSINPISQTVSVGSSFDVAITLADLGEHVAPSVSAFDLSINFNPTLLSFSGATFGDPIWGDQLDLSGLGNINSVTSILGIINLVELSLDDASTLDNLQLASFTLATLSFSALAEGADSLNLTVNGLGDAFGEPLTADAINGNITITSSTSVSEPYAGLLISLVILIFFFRRAKVHGIWQLWIKQQRSFNSPCGNQ